MQPLYSIVILTKNSVGIVNRLVDAIAQQHFNDPYELIFMDNDSKDGTVEYLNSIPYPDKRVIHVPAGQFSHSGTRMQAAQLARGGTIMFFTDDIIPIGPDFLTNLSEPLRQNDVAAAYGVFQINSATSDPIDAYLHNRWYEGFDPVTKPVTQTEWDSLSPELRRRLCNFDDCSSCINREFLLKHPFKPVAYGEDMLFAKTLLLHGYKIAIAKDARFHHWHKVSFGYLFKRMLIDADLSLLEFGVCYVHSFRGVISAIFKRSLHRAWIGLFKIKAPLHKKFYWVFYNARILTADFFGKYAGTLNATTAQTGFTYLKQKLYQKKLATIAQIEKDSIKRY